MILRSDRDRVPARRAGFTLLEVLVVVAIIVMLAGVGGYYLLQRYEATKDSKAKLDAKGLSAQIQTYYLDHQVYPNAITDLAQPPGGGRAYVPIDKLKDPWGQQYQMNIANDATGTEQVEVFTINPKTGQRLSSH